MSLAIGQTTLGAMVLQARQRSDQATSNFLSPTEWEANVNDSVKEQYSIEIQRYGSDYHVAEPYDITTNGTSEVFDLPSNFLKALGVDLVIAAQPPNNLISIPRFNFGDRNKYVGANAVSWYGRQFMAYRLRGSQLWLRPLPASGQTIRVWYIPKCPQLVTTGVISLYSVVAGNTLTFNGTNYVADTDFDVGADDDATAVNLAAAMNVPTDAVQGNYTATAVGSTVQIALSDDLGYSVTWSVNSATTMTLSPVGTWTNVLEGYNDWQQIVICDAAIKAMQKEESDCSVLMRQKQELINRLDAEAENRDAGNPQTIVDVEGSGFGNGFGWTGSGF